MSTIVSKGQTQKDLVKQEKTFTIAVKDLWEKENGYKKDTITINDTVFKIKLDTSGADTVIIRSIELQIPGDKRDITNTVGTEEFKIGADSIFTFTFSIANRVIFTDSIGIPHVTCTVTNIKSGESEVKFFRKTELDSIRNFLLRDFTINEKDTLIKYAKQDTAFKQEKKIMVLFKREGKAADAFTKELAAFKTEVKSLIEEPNVKKSIGAFTLLADKIKVHSRSYKDSTVEKRRIRNLFKKLPYKIQVPFYQCHPATISRVEILVANGAIAKNGLMLELENDSIYRNRKSPISLYKFWKRTGDKIYLQNSSKNKYINLGDLINYNYSGKFHYPDDDTAMLSPLRKKDSVYNYSSFNDLINVAIFSDLLGLIGRKPNGIIQTQLSANFTTNTTNIRNTDLMLFSFIKPYFRLSKFDSKFSQIDSTILKNDTLYNRLYLNQTAYLQAGVKVNVLRMGMGANHTIAINFGMDVNRTSADSLLNTDITSINYYPEIEYKINGPENFGMEASVRWISQQVGKSSPFKNINGVWIFNPEMLIYYASPTNPASRIYVKYAHFAEINAGKYNFGQFQFGYKTTLFKNK